MSKVPHPQRGIASNWAGNPFPRVGTGHDFTLVGTGIHIVQTDDRFETLVGKPCVPLIKGYCAGSINAL